MRLEASNKNSISWRSILIVMIAFVAVGLSGHMAWPRTAAKKSSLEGVWKTTKIQIPGTKDNNNPPPGLLILTKGYYSYLAIAANERHAAAPPADPQRLTDEDKVARYAEWNPFVAQSGTYEIAGQTMNRRATIAKNVSSTGTMDSYQFGLSGNSLILTSESGPFKGVRVTYVRVE